MSRIAWVPWTQPVLSSNTDYGTVSTSSESRPAYLALDGSHTGSATSWEGGANVYPAWWKWELPVTLRISQILLYNKYTGNTKVTKNVDLFSDAAMTQQIGSRMTFEQGSFSTLTVTPDTPVETNVLVVNCVDAYGTPSLFVGLGEVVLTAEVQELQYEVSFVDWDGEALSTAWVPDNGTATPPSSPVRDGYAFIGWSASLSGISGDTTITAQYMLAASHTVTFVDWNGAVLKTETVTSGSAATAPAAPAREGYSFTGWDQSFDVITADTTVTAQYAVFKTVVFKDWDDTVLETETVVYGTAATAPTQPVRLGYVFSGWDCDFSMVASDTVVTAQYTANSTYYTVTFYFRMESAGASDSYTSVRVHEGDCATAPAPTEYLNFTFQGWKEQSSNTIVDVSTYVISKNTSFWTVYQAPEMYSVIFRDWNGSEITYRWVYLGWDATPPPDPVREGYVFTGWSGSYTNITTSTTVTATYRIDEYTVTFVDWDGTVLKTETVSGGSDATPPEVPTHDGYSFVRWDTQYSEISADTQVTAIYVTTIYDVTFTDWDGSTIVTLPIEHGEDAFPPPQPVREGYRFTAWDGVYTNVIADSTVVARYVKVWTVEFLDRNGQVLQSCLVDEGADATPPPDPFHTGFVFTGWDGTYTNITADTTVTATFIHAYLVRFFDHDGTVLKSEAVQYGERVLPPDPPIREGYTFSEWSADTSFITIDAAVFAVYLKNRSHVNVYSNGALILTVDKVMSATLRDSLDGELTFEFTSLASRLTGLCTGCLVELDGMYFNVVRVTKSIQSGNKCCAVLCEHVTYILNDAAYSVNTMDFTGTPAEALAYVLSGTPFSAGSVDFSGTVTLQINQSVSRRGALMQLIALMDGEIEYSGYAINIRSHRGSAQPKDMIGKRNITDVGVTFDSRSNTASYEISFFKLADLSAGDEVSIVFPPLGIDTLTRIISVEYNPFFRYNVRVEVGNYKPTINDSLYRLEQEIGNGLEDMVTDICEEVVPPIVEEAIANAGATLQTVKNLQVYESAFDVTYTDNTIATFDYTVNNTSGRIMSITRRIQA